MTKYSAWQIPEILLPNPAIDLTKWSVVACDQYTSESAYWQTVEKIVADSPSAYYLTFPEIYLGQPDETARLKKIQQTMQDYLSQNIWRSYNGLIYLERQIGQKIRRGLMLALDLEKYDYQKGSQSLIRATEGTIIDRLPPRIKIRQNAAVELPHIMVLIDDRQKKIIEPLNEQKNNFSKLYDFPLMQNGGQITGYLLPADVTSNLCQLLETLGEEEYFRQHYQTKPTDGTLQFAVGDGNHSLATAKAIWEQNKEKVGLDHPSRYALVEIVNLHDESLEFKPIHRVLFNLQTDLRAELEKFFSANITFSTCPNFAELIKEVEQEKTSQAFGLLLNQQYFCAKIAKPLANISVGSLQIFLDDFLARKLAEKIDYVHGEEALNELSSAQGNAGFYLSAIEKNNFFQTVISDGALPRKTFSMGEASEKRYYLEARKIS